MLTHNQNNQQITERMEAEKAAKLKNDRYQPSQTVNELAAHVKGVWHTSKTARFEVTDRLTDCLRRRKSKYANDKLEQIKKTNGSEIFMSITGSKCRAAKAWLSDLFSPAGDKPYSLEATPVSDLPPELEQQLINTAVQGAMQLGVPPQQLKALVEKHADRLKDELKQEAELRINRMSDHIEDILVESNWRKEFNAFIDDLVTYPAAILKGPIYRRKKRLSWQKDEKTGGFAPKVVFELVREFKRVSPFDFFPSASASDIDEGDTIERIRLFPSDLVAMKGAKGYDDNAINGAIKDFRVGGLREWLFNDGERERLEGKKSAFYTTDTIDGLEYNGTIDGKRLIMWGMSPESIPDPSDEYSVSVVLIGNYVIRAMVNPNPTGRAYYYKSCWNPIPDSFWGEALPEVLADTQDACNGAARSLMNNLAIASGPQVAVDVSTLPPGMEPGKLAPWKIWKYNGQSLQGSRPGISFFQADSNASELLNVYERFSKYADDISGLPAFAYGSDGGAGAAKTASGLSMLLNSASKPIKEVVRQVDINVIEPIIGTIYISCMLDPNVPNENKGDAKAKARGSDTLIHKEAATARQQELLAITNNPTDMQIIGLEGRREQLKEVYKSADIPVDRVIPTEEELNQRLMQQQEQGANNEES